MFLILSSCNKENPVEPPPPPPSGYQFDSARYDWQIDTLIGYGYSPNGYFVLDSSDYYMVTDNSQFIHHDKYGFHFYTLPPLMIPAHVYGKNKNEIFVGGNQLFIGSNNTLLRLVLWNGSTLKDIPIPDTLFNYDQFISSIYKTNDNMIWLATNLGKIIKYDGTNFTYYYFSNSYHFGAGVIGFYEQENQFYALAIKLDSYGWYDSVFIFRYTNNFWEMDYERGYPEPHTYNNFFEQINGYLITLEKDGLYKFSGFSFIKIQNLDEKMFGKYGIFNTFTGGSENNLIIEAPFGDFGNTGLYHWNGIKWSKELSDIISYFHAVFYANTQYFFFREDWLNSYVYKAKPKTFQINLKSKK